MGIRPEPSNTEGFNELFDMREGVFTHLAPGHTWYLDAEKGAILKLLLQQDLANCHELKIAKPIRKILLNALLDYYRLHLEHMSVINAHQIISTVLE